MSETSRFLLLGGVGTIRGRIRNAGPALVAVCDELDPILAECGFRGNAPFERIDGMIRFGAKASDEVLIGPIRDAGLQVTVEIEMAPLQHAPLDVVKAAFRRATVKALLAIAEKFDLPSAGLDSGGSSRK